PSVVDVVAFNGATTAGVLFLAAAAETRSEHPLARAVLRYAEAAGIDLPTVSSTSAIVGRGVRAVVDGRTVYAGSARLFDEMGGLEADVLHHLARFEARGETTMLVGTASADGSGPPLVQGMIAIADRLRPEAATALRELHRSGIRHIAMLTGDDPGTARAIADALGGPGMGLDAVHAGLLPADKVAAVQALRREHGTILMVGDGVNDAPALAASDVGVAMGSAGTDVAL